MEVLFHGCLYECTYALTCIYTSYQGGSLTPDGESELDVHVCLYRCIYSCVNLCAGVLSSSTRCRLNLGRDMLVDLVPLYVAVCMLTAMDLGHSLEIAS